MHTAAFSPTKFSTARGSHQVLERGAHLREREGHALAERLARGKSEKGVRLAQKM